MTSLRRSMMRVLFLTIGICWVLSLAALLIYTQVSSSSIWDKQLQSVAKALLLAVPQDDPSSRDQSPGPPMRSAGLAEAGLMTYQVWDGREHLMARAPGAPDIPLQADFKNGFSSPLVDGKTWRVYSTSDSSGQWVVQVGNLHSVIDAEMRRKAFIALSITTLVLGLVGLLMWRVLRRALLPVVVIEGALRGRRRLDLTPLPVRALPSELQPLVQAFNQMLGQLDQALESERRLIGNAAHELRTPLSALQAHAQVALRATTLADKDATLLKLLVVVQRSARLSEQLLDMARLDASSHGPQRTEADLGELIGYVADEFDVQAAQQQRTIHLNLQPCQIQCDIDEMGILLRNLIDNALRYTQPGGRVRISCAATPGGGYLTVADDGPGVPEAEREAIFERFHRITGTGERGSGIGLSLVKSIAQGHDAHIVTGVGLAGRGLAITVYFASQAVVHSPLAAPAP
ncbi:MAG: ATP-binding protein [Pseudomonas sp.]|nr:ATP-binding protein [Pseudomonas sp.]